MNGIQVERVRVKNFDPARVRGLLFDVDGTLADTDNDYVTSFARWVPSTDAAQRERTARRLVMAMETPGNALLTLLDRVGLDTVLLRISERIGRVLNRAPARAHPPVPGVPEMLARLQGRYLLAVVSARETAHVAVFLEQSGLGHYFDVVIGSDSCEYSKPFPDPVLRAARDLGLHADECVMIGDTTVDIRAGRSAGAQTIGVLCGFGEAGELLRCGADVLLASTADLLELLQM